VGPRGGGEKNQWGKIHLGNGESYLYGSAGKLFWNGKEVVVDDFLLGGSQEVVDTDS